MVLLYEGVAAYDMMQPKRLGRPMASVKWLVPLALAMVAALGGCGTPATPEERASLFGVWTPTDRSGRIITFHEDGVFGYQYFATLRLLWELGNQGEIRLLGRWWCALEPLLYLGGQPSEHRQRQRRILHYARFNPAPTDATGIHPQSMISDRRMWRCWPIASTHRPWAAQRATFEYTAQPEDNWHRF